jgi:hypothetical protein
MKIACVILGTRGDVQPMFVGSHFYMRRLIFIILILLATEYCIGQTDTCETKKIIFGITACAFTSYAIPGINYYGPFTIDKGKSSFTIGPIIGPKWKLNSDYIYALPTSSQIGIYGFCLDYQLFPQKKCKIFDYFVQDQLVFHYYKDKSIDNEYPNDSYQSYLLNIVDYIGGGYKINFLKRFYFIQSVGVGFIYHHLSINFSKLSDHNNEGCYMDLITNIGLGYKFDFKK